MPLKDIRRPAKSWRYFEEGDEDFIHLIDIIGHQYGVLPSEILRLDWFDILVCGKCIMARGERIKKITRSKKKAMIFPTVDISTLADILG